MKTFFINPFHRLRRVVTAVHGQDQPFTIVQMMRDADSHIVTDHQAYFGTLGEHLRRLRLTSEVPYELYMVLGVTHDQSTKIDNFRGSWAVAVDFDHGLPDECQPSQPLAPTLVIETSPDRFHAVWLFDRLVEPDYMHRLAKVMASRLDGDMAMARLNQMIRLPDAVNQKYGCEVVLLRDSLSSGEAFDPAWLWLACDGGLYEASVRKDLPRVDHTVGTSHAESSETRLKHAQEAADYLAGLGWANNYDTWIKVLLNLASLGAAGRPIALAFSAKSPKFNADEFDRKWEYLVKSGGSSGAISTLFAMAHKAGWKNPGWSDSDAIQPTARPPSDREFGVEIARHLDGKIAAIDAATAGRLKGPVIFYQWTGDGYVELEARTKRTLIAEAGRAVISGKGTANAAAWKDMERKLGNNRTLDEVCDHVAEALVPMSEPRVVGRYPYLPVQNGVLNLLTRRLVPHRYQAVPINVCNVSFDPTARADRFRAFLAEIFIDDEAMVRYMLRVLGYAMLGRPREQAFFILLGQTAGNGKSKLLGLIEEIFGAFSTILKMETLMQKSHVSDGASPGLAKLKGKRFAVTAEPTEKHRFDTSLLKMLTGEAKMESRSLYAGSEEFPIEFTLLLSANKMPLVPSDDEGMWRRVQVIPFDRAFRGNEIEKDLSEHLLAERSGILNVLLEGVADYLEHDGLKPPSRVTGSIATRREEADPFAVFVKEACELQTRVESQLKDLWAGYQIWAQANTKFGTKTKKEFQSYLEANFDRITKKHLPVIVGLKLTNAN